MVFVPNARTRATSQRRKRTEPREHSAVGTSHTEGHENNFLKMEKVKTASVPASSVLVDVWSKTEFTGTVIERQPST